MHRERDRLDILAARVAQGSTDAAARFRKELGPQLERMVRQALRGGTGNAVFDSWVLAEVSRAAAAGAVRPSAGSERCAVPVARQLWQTIWCRLRPPAPNAGSTVCGP
jgi:hypothetical protein